MVSKTKIVRLNDGSAYQLRGRGKTAEEARLALDKLIWEFERGELAISSQMTVNNWFKNWDKIYAKPIFSAADYKQHVANLRKYFLPYIGEKRLCNLSSMDMQECANRLSNMSKSHISKCRIVIKSLFGAAMSNNLMTVNPLRDIRWPPGVTGARRALYDHEREILFDLLQTHPKGLFFALMYGMGLRPGEARAATFANVDYENNKYTVKEAIKKSTKKPGTPKTKSGNRTLPIPGWLMEMIKVAPKNGIYLVSNTKGSFLTESQAEKAWLSFKNQMYLKVGIPTYRNQIDPILAEQSSIHELTPYYLRHTYCTMLAENNVPLRTAQYLMGHSSIEMTAKIYTHITDTMIEQASDIVNSMYQPSKSSVKLIV